MPVHRVIRLDLEDAIRRFEAAGERIVQIIPEAVGEYLVVTESGLVTR